MSQHSVYLHYLQDILENAEMAIQFVDGMNKDDFLKDEKTLLSGNYMPQKGKVNKPKLSFGQ